MIPDIPTLADLPPASVYLVTGDDYQDDPAWGMSALREGTIAEVVDWLRDQPALDDFSVVLNGGEAMWAVDFLARQV